MTRAPRRFSVSDGVSVKDLIHYGQDNLSAARKLLSGSASHYDSAGYLAHMGVELLLKAWHLQVSDSFPGIHSLTELWARLKELSSVRDLRPRSRRTLHLLDQYEQLRYPTTNAPIEVGSEDAIRINNLVESLYLRMPSELIETHNSINVLAKGGRVLMKRPVGSRLRDA